VEPNPTVGPNFEGAGDARDVFVSCDYAYLAENAQGLTVVDVFSINPQEIGRFNDADCFSMDVAVSGSYAYIADYGILSVLNISDLENPFLEDRLNTTGYSEGVYIQDPYVYLADGTNGLLIVDKYPTNW